MAALKFLQKQKWEGNVRQLKNFTLQSAALSPNIEISEEHVVKKFEFKPEWAVDSLDNKLDKFVYYLERHIELDGGEHGPLALQLISDLCGNDESKWNEVQEVAISSLIARKRLWDEVLCQL